MSEVKDEILDIMASQLREILILGGADPKSPPTKSTPPSSAVFTEYKRRGGMNFSDPYKLTAELIRRVGKDE